MTLLAFISCLHRASKSARSKRLGTNQVLPGHANGLLDHQEYVAALKSPLRTTHSPDLSFKFLAWLFFAPAGSAALGDCNINCH